MVFYGELNYYINSLDINSEIYFNKFKLLCRGDSYGSVNRV